KVKDTALLFDLNNVFTSGGVLGGWQGFGFGAQKKLRNGRIARLAVELSRVTDPVDIVKTTRTNGTMEVTSYDIQIPGSGWSAQHSVAVVLDMIKPLTDKKVAPYIGVGAVARYTDLRLSYDDEVTVVDQTTAVRNSSTSGSLGLRGIAGVSWKVSDAFT